MLCEHCNKGIATVWVTKIEGQEVTKIHLCEECIKLLTSSLSINLSFPFFFSTFLNHLQEAKEFHPSRLNRFKVCSKCGVSFSDFIHSGYLGCPHCYHLFWEQLSPLLREIHGNLEYKGKLPKLVPEELVLKSELKNLKSELFLLIEKENYEKAAEIRDKIKEVKERLIKVSNAS